MYAYNCMTVTLQTVVNYFIGVTRTGDMCCCVGRPCLDENVDCNGNGQCQILANGDPICVCDHSRYVHSDGAPTAGDCRNTVCGDSGLVCQNAGLCV